MERRTIKNRNEDTSVMENGETIQIHQPSNIKGDRTNIFLLLCLYTLQGIPLGLSSAIPMILQNRGVSYKQQVSCNHKLLIFQSRLSGRIQFCNVAFQFKTPLGSFSRFNFFIANRPPKNLAYSNAILNRRFYVAVK